MTKLSSLRMALAATLAVCGCSGYRASTAHAPASDAPVVPTATTPDPAQQETASRRRIGVQKPSDDTPVNSGAGDPKPMGE